MTRRTKIVATIGPASDSPEVLNELIDAGVDVFRLGTAHDPVERVLERVETIRSVAKGHERPVGILVDLAGPKVRAAFGDEAVELVGQTTVKIHSGEDQSSATDIYVNVDDIAKSLMEGDRLHMGDGSATLVVTEVGAEFATATVERGGIMRGRPGVHVPSSRLTASSPTPEDLKYFDAVVAADVDFVAVSFVKRGRDMRALDSERPPHGPMLIAKIETQAAIDNLESILTHSDAIMVARGDLGLEVSLAGLPVLQKKIITESVAAGRPVITATQMLESMTTAPSPTRAEVTDVANSVFDGTSAVMLSGETAVGHDPVLVVRTMAEILQEAEHNFDYDAWAVRMRGMAPRPDEEVNDTRRVAAAMRGAASQAVMALGSRVLVAVTGTGRTAREISRFRPRADIVAITPSERVARQLCLSWAVVPIVGSLDGTGTGRAMAILSRIRDAGHLKPGELVPMVLGNSNSALVSNVMRIENVPS